MDTRQILWPHNYKRLNLNIPIPATSARDQIDTNSISDKHHNPNHMNKNTEGLNKDDQLLNLPALTPEQLEKIYKQMGFRSTDPPITLGIKETMAAVYEANKAKGFWDEKRNIGEMLMLIVSELSEALEADRKGRYMRLENIQFRNIGTPEEDETFKSGFENYIKDTFEDEIADSVIRLFDISAGLGIDLEFHIKSKMRYNAMRPHKHGKKY